MLATQRVACATSKHEVGGLGKESNYFHIIMSFAMLSIYLQLCIVFLRSAGVLIIAYAHCADDSTPANLKIMCIIHYLF